MKRIKDWYDGLHYQTQTDVVVVAFCAVCGIFGIGLMLAGH